MKYEALNVKKVNGEVLCYDSRKEGCKYLLIRREGSKVVYICTKGK